MEASVGLHPRLLSSKMKWPQNELQEQSNWQHITLCIARITIAVQHLLVLLLKSKASLAYLIFGEYLAIFLASQQCQMLVFWHSWIEKPSVSFHVEQVLVNTHDFYLLFISIFCASWRRVIVAEVKRRALHLLDTSPALFTLTSVFSWRAPDAPSRLCLF